MREEGAGRRGKIKSEHVARVSDVGKLRHRLALHGSAVEYLEGSDLAGMLEKRGPLPVEEAVDFVLQACEAIAEAHVLGIVHRDLKPANLFCVRRADGRLSIKVLDFGISKMGVGTAGGPQSSTGRDVSMTRTTAIMGSPLYMSPEQMQSSKQVDTRSDIWALGVILYELVSGKTPFDAEVVTELVIKIATQPPARLRMIKADVPAGPRRDHHAVPREGKHDSSTATSGELAVALEPFAPEARQVVDRSHPRARWRARGALPRAAAPRGAPRPSAGRAAEGAGTVAAWGRADRVGHREEQEGAHRRRRRGRRPAARPPSVGFFGDAEGLRRLQRPPRRPRPPLLRRYAPAAAPERAPRRRRLCQSSPAATLAPAPEPAARPRGRTGKPRARPPAMGPGLAPRVARAAHAAAPAPATHAAAYWPPRRPRPRLRRPR